MQSRHSKLCLCSLDIQNFIVCAVATFKTLLFVQSRHSKLYCLCSRDIQNFIVCAVATFKTLLFVQSRHSKLYCLCSRDIRNFIVCAIATFKTLLFVQSRHSKLYCLCSRAIRNFLVCVSLLGLRMFAPVNPQRNSAGRPNVSKKHHSFEHLPQVAQSRLVCVLASLERNKMQRKHTLPLLSSKLINNMGNLCANEVNFCRLNSFYFDLSVANQSACYIRSIS